MATVDEDYITTEEALRLLKISRSTLWRWVGQGELPAYRLGRRRVLIKRSDLEKLIRPAREEKGELHGHMNGERKRLHLPLSAEEQKQGLAALEAAERFSAELRNRHGGRLLPDSVQSIREMRDKRTRELS